MIKPGTIRIMRRDIPGYPGYAVDSDGQVYGKTGRQLKTFIGTGGYLRFTTYEKGRWQQVSVHVMVCEAFYGPKPDGLQAAHRNGNRLDNRADNLRWATAAENQADRVLHGTSNHGERNWSAKLTEAQVLAIRASDARGTALAEEYGVTPSAICGIRKRKTWRHI